jgi:hypothetical protein
VTDRGLFYRPIHSVKAALQKRRREEEGRKEEEGNLIFHVYELR